MIIPRNIRDAIETAEREEEFGDTIRHPKLRLEREGGNGRKPRHSQSQSNRTPEVAVPPASAENATPTAPPVVNQKKIKQDEKEEVQMNTNDLPDLDGIVVKPLTDEEKATAEAEAKRRKTFAETAGEKLAVIDREIAEIENDPEKLTLSPTLQTRLAELKAGREKITKAGDEGLQKHVEFSKFLNEIRNAKPEEAGAIISRALGMKRIRKATGDANLVFWNKDIYEPSPDSTGKVTPAAIALMGELRKLVEKNKRARKDAFQQRVSEIKTRATTVTWQQLLTAIPHPKGFIYGYLEDEIRVDGRTKRIDSHILVESDGRLIKIVEVAGAYNGFLMDCKARNRFIAVHDLRERKICSGLVSKDVLRDAEELLRILIKVKQPPTQTTTSDTTTGEEAVATDLVAPAGINQDANKAADQETTDTEKPKGRRTTKKKDKAVAAA